MDGFRRGCRLVCLCVLALLLILPLGFCGYLRWHEPRHALPPEVVWSDILAFRSDFGLREGCSFGVYRISDKFRNRLLHGGKMPADWRQTPLAIRDGQYTDLGPNGSEITLYALSAVTCASDTAKRYRLVEAYSAVLEEPGNWVKVINHGEAMIVVAPERGLAWMLNFG